MLSSAAAAVELPNMRVPFLRALVFIAAFVGCVQSQSNPDGARCFRQGSGTRCTFDTSQLNLASEDATELQFFDTKGNAVQCTKQAIQNGWYGGECDDDQTRDANFVQRQSSMGTKVFGSVRMGTDVCHIQPNANGTQDIMICLPETDFPPEHEGLVPPAADEDDYNRHVRQLPVGFDAAAHPNGGAKDAHGRLLFDDSGSTIDILVVWTKAAECAASSLSVNCALTATTESNMRGLIDLAVAETNTAYSLSGMLASLRLVYAYRDATYVEPSSFDTTLSNLRSRTDGKLDNVHALRTLYGADMVQMIIANNDYCGIAYVDSTRANTFAVISYQCATGYYSFGHEIGHNFEMLHDRGQEDACSASGFNYGYRSPTAAFRSILAYRCTTGQCDKMPSDGCTRVQRFSNTEFLYNGQAIGSAQSNNALQFNNLRATIAAHFPAMNCQSDDQCNDSNANTIDTCNVAKAICVFSPASVPTPVLPAPVPIPTPVFLIPPFFIDPPPYPCGLFGMGWFCPMTLCGLLGRYLGLCVGQ